MTERPAKLIADAVARTGIYHKRTGLLAAVIALAGCIGVVAASQPTAKAVLLALGAGFGVVAWRSMKRANQYFDPAISPVLRAIVRDRNHIAVIRPEQLDDASTALLIIEDDGGHRLDLRVPVDDRDELPALMDAFSKLAPDAEVRRSANQGPPDKVT